MATFTALQRVLIDPGTYTSPAFPLSKLKRFKASVDALASVWNDNSIRVTLVVEKSEDGGTVWKPWYTLNIEGGHYAKDGSLPGLELYDIDPELAEKAQVRLVFSINKRIRIGLKGENA